MKNKQRHILTVGITGGIGSGKTEAAKIFQQLGGRVLFADEIARELVNSNQTIKRKIQNTFGKDIYRSDGHLDRKKVASLVFQYQKLRKKLDAIVHPYVLKFIEKEITKAKLSRNDSPIFVEAALIFEAHAEQLFDYIVVVDAEKEQAIERIMERDHVTRKEVLQRIDAQIPTKDKVARADFILENNGNKALLQKNCKFLFNLLTNLANKK